MRYRQHSPDGDYVFSGWSRFLVDSPETVVQAIKTRMSLFVKEWFLDLEEGLDLSRIMGYHTQNTRDQELKRRILGTQGVTLLVTYESELTPTRNFVVRATVNTLYGQVTFTQDYQL